jgi:hypothetical protein
MSREEESSSWDRCPRWAKWLSGVSAVTSVAIVALWLSSSANDSFDEARAETSEASAEDDGGAESGADVVGDRSDEDAPVFAHRSWSLTEDDGDRPPSARWTAAKKDELVRPEVLDKFQGTTIVVEESWRAQDAHAVEPDEDEFARPSLDIEQLGDDPPAAPLEQDGEERVAAESDVSDLAGDRVLSPAEFERLSAKGLIVTELEARKLLENAGPDGVIRETRRN